jgi:lipoprotein
MKRIIYIVLTALFITACNGNGSASGSSNNGSSSNESEAITEDTYSAKNQGYQKGYQDGYSDGYGWRQHGVSYNDRSSDTTDEGIYAFKNGYRNGYNEGYDEGEEKIKRERLSDWHNWDDEDVDGIYMEIDADNDDEADYIARQYYEGEYIEEWGDYYAKISLNWREYEVTLGRRISSHLYQISGTNKYIHFKWMADVSSGDEGVLDWSGTFSSFYKKPNGF